MVNLYRQRKWWKMAYFGLKYYAEMRSKYKGVIWRVEIAERGFIGIAEHMDFSGSNPLKITWENRGDDFFVPVKANEASITVMCHKNFHYINLFTSDTLSLFLPPLMRLQSEQSTDSTSYPQLTFTMNLLLPRPVFAPFALYLCHV